MGLLHFASSKSLDIFITNRLNLKLPVIFLMLQPAIQLIKKLALVRYCLEMYRKQLFKIFGLLLVVQF